MSNLEGMVDAARRRLDNFHDAVRLGDALTTYEAPPDVHLNTAIAAIECGIKLDDSGDIAEGLVLLYQLRDRLYRKEA